MKTRNLLFGIAIFLFGSIAGELQAQTNLDTFMKKCENNDKLTYEVLKTKDKETKKLRNTMITVSFSKKEDPQLAQEFMNALKADEDDATSVNTTKRSGRISYFYIFNNGQKSTTYDISIYNSDSFRVSCCENFNTGSKDHVYIGNLNDLNFKFPTYIYSDSLIIKTPDTSKMIREIYKSKAGENITLIIPEKWKNLNKAN